MLMRYYLSAQQLSLTLMLTLLTACAQLDRAPVVAPESWQSHRQQLESLEHWTLRGRLTVRDEQTSRSINLRWIQAGEHFDINLSGSLGIGSVRVHGDQQGLSIAQSGQEDRQVDSLEDLSEALLGYAFPADNLHYWVRGIMAPDSPWQGEWNEYALLATLQQSQWHIAFDRYQFVEGLNLPGRIELTSAPWQLTFRVSDWHLNADSWSP